MGNSLRAKLNGAEGMSRLVALLLVAIIVMCVVISVPSVRWYQAHSAQTACAAGLDSARRRLAENYLSGNFDQNAREAKAMVAYAMNGWDDLCPSGGKIYLVKNEDSEMPFDLLCGMHCSDKKRCTRLNSNYVLEQLKEGLLKSQRAGEPYPTELSFYLNGETWTALLTDEETGLKRGTSTTKGLEKKHIVAYYGIAGHSDFCAGCGAEEGSICYFSFADDNHCANWRFDDGWTGDSYAAR